MKISFVGHSHHRVTQSSRFFVDLLHDIGDVEFYWDDTWRGSPPIDARRVADAAELVVVWQSVAYIKRLCRLDHPNIVYVPMYDAAKGLRRSFWEPLSGLKILNFSSALHQRVQQCGCRFSAYFQYFPNPEEHSPTTDFTSLRGFFWQRQPRPGWEQVRPLLDQQFASFHLHLAADPNAPELPVPAESEQREWGITVTRWFPEKAAMLERLTASNVYFAPRIDEGIGLSFLEAMAMGMAVCAHDAPTHNEYIVDNVNGFLYPLNQPTAPDWSRAEAMGSRARGSIEKGYRRWMADRDRLLEFLTRPTSGPVSWRYAHPVHPGISRSTEHPGSNAPPVGATRRREGGRRVSEPDRAVGCPKVTVATVVRNAPLDLAATLASVVSQTYRYKEILVIDGGSYADTLDLLNCYGDDIDFWRSEPDDGPYDAMNKAADLARGHWILFINAGDALVDEEALDRFVAGVPDDADFVAGHHVYWSPQGTEDIHRCVDFERTYRQLLAGKTDGAWLSGIPGHQAVLTRTDLIRQHRYDTAYRLAADHEFMYRMRRLGARFRIEPVIVSQYVSGGLSSQNLFACLDEWRAIARRYTESPEQVERHFRRLLFDTLRFSRRIGTFSWRSEPARRHPAAAALVELEFWLRRLLEGADGWYARLRALGD